MKLMPILPLKKGSDMAIGREKLKPEVRDAVLKAVAAGLPQEFVAKAAKVAPRTLRHWLKRGRTEGRGQYHDLYRAVREAENEAVATSLAIIRKAAAEREDVVTKVTTFPDGTTKTETTTRTVLEWQAAAWYLERTRPEYFSNHTRDLAELKRMVKELNRSEPKR